MKEVISLPAAQTMDLIKKYLIHAHPHPRTYKEAQYMTFRKVGGVMDTLYSIENELVLKPEEQNIYEQISFLNTDIKERLRGYINERKYTFGFGEKEDYKFYILKIEKNLNHLPIPKEGNMQSHTYYTYNEITHGKREIIRESQLKKIKRI
ncbi:hypothetical protein [Solibacillus sp. FSL W7-1324]|uniref:hypothetical protein n=1 Tax=Solibacillus sp. FSL W7-1324 TaxID=2921701 RepID=UPI0030F8E28C